MAATASNAINIASAGIVVFDGTSVFSADTVTQYNTLVGGTSNTISNISPGTSGQVLTSNGASSNPSYQAVPMVFTPNSTVSMFDDFIGAVQTGSPGNLASNMAWNIITQSSSQWIGSSPTSESGHPGILGNSALSSSATYLGLFAGAAANTIVLGGGTITLNWVFKINTLSTGTNRYTLNIGLGDVGLGSFVTDQANGCYFKYSDNVNSGNWEIVTASASSLTTTTTSTAVATGWHNAQISINSAASSVSFTLDGVSLGSIATNIPTAAINPLFYIARNAGSPAANSLVPDLFYLTETLTTAR